MKKIITILLPALAIITLIIFAPSCEKDVITASDGSPDLSSIGWMEPSSSSVSTSSRIYILSEGFVGDRPPSGYRIQGRIKDRENSSLHHPITNIELGDLIIPALTQAQVNGDPTGIIHKVLSPRQNEAEWSIFQESIDREITLKVNDAQGVFTEQTIQIAPPLRASISQEGVSFYELSELDKTKPLTISWPTDRVGTRSSTYEDKVGATILYSPKETERQSTGGSFPSQSITREFIVPFDYGAITFTEDDLALFPSNGMVTVYVGSIRYEIDANGNPVQSSSGGNISVVSGGTSGTPFIRVNEP